MQPSGTQPVARACLPAQQSLELCVQRALYTDVVCMRGWRLGGHATSQCAAGGSSSRAAPVHACKLGLVGNLVEGVGRKGRKEGGAGGRARRRDGRWQHKARAQRHLGRSERHIWLVTAHAGCRSHACCDGTVCSSMCLVSDPASAAVTLHKQCCWWACLAWPGGIACAHEALTRHQQHITCMRQTHCSVRRSSSTRSSGSASGASTVGSMSRLLGVNGLIMGSARFGCGGASCHACSHSLGRASTEYFWSYLRHGVVCENAWERLQARAHAWAARRLERAVVTRTGPPHMTQAWLERSAVDSRASSSAVDSRASCSTAHLALASRPRHTIACHRCAASPPVNAEHVTRSEAPTTLW
jgi:hypothetical protein